MSGHFRDLNTAAARARSQLLRKGRAIGPEVVWETMLFGHDRNCSRVAGTDSRIARIGPSWQAREAKLSAFWLPGGGPNRVPWWWHSPSFTWAP